PVKAPAIPRPRTIRLRRPIHPWRSGTQARFPRTDRCLHSVWFLSSDPQPWPEAPWSTTDFHIRANDTSPVKSLSHILLCKMGISVRTDGCKILKSLKHIFPFL